MNNSNPPRSPASSECWLAARLPSASATFHLLADSSRAMYSISATLVSLIRACLVVPISILLGGLVVMDFLLQEARLGEPFIASPLEGEGDLPRASSPRSPPSLPSFHFLHFTPSTFIVTNDRLDLFARNQR